MSLLNSASLVVTPNGYKEGTLYSVIPNTTLGDMTVVRATTATRVNSAGLIELVPYNLLQYSEQFNNAYWQKLNGGIGLIPTVTANTATAPDGTLTADRIQLSLNGGTSGTDISYINTSVSTTAATFSIYAKSNTTPCTIYFRSGSTVTTINITTEWQRFELYSSGAITVAQFGLRGGSYGGAVNSNTADISVWGGQLNEGLTAKDYLRTETRLNIPRLDYSNGSCPSLLLEPQRTNLALYSEQFDNAAWTKTGVTISANATSSPSGTTSADKIIANASGGDKTTFQLISITIGQAFTISAFFKKSEYRLAFVRAGGQTASPYVIYNLDTEAVVSTSGASSTKIEDYGNGWYRILLTLNSATGGTCAPNFSFIPDSGYTLSGVNIPQYTGDGTSGGFVWGCQLEANGAAYATSYIPTTTAAVTRNADVISKTGISSLINGSEGVVFIEMAAFQDTATTREIIIGSFPNDYVRFGYVNYGAAIQFRYYSAGALIFNRFYDATITNFNKIAFGWQSNNFVVYENGVKKLEQLSGATSVAAFNSIDTSILTFNGKIQSFMIFKTRLSNAELAQLTTI